MAQSHRKSVRIARRLEGFARRATREILFEGGLEGILGFQEDIFKLQIEIQQAINEAKRLRMKDAETLSLLEELRRLRWFSRRLGDALAWNLLLHNRQIIQSLYQESSVPVVSAWSDGHRGAFEFAKSATGPAWGVPIIHDITNVLRIGDVTFMNPNLNPSDSIFRTVELKTTRVSEETTPEGETVLGLNVTVVSNEPIPMLRAPDREAGDRKVDIAPTNPARREDRRLARQMKRLDAAMASKYAKLNEFTKIGDNQIFTIQVEDEQESHWKELRRAIRQARRDGYSYFEIDEFVGYSLIYSARGVTVEDISATPLAEHVTGLMHDEIGDRNSITLTTIPEREDDQYGHSVLPFYLWEVPQRAIKDLLRGRLMIAATYNSGWIEKLLEEAGATINTHNRPGKDSRGFEVVLPLSWDNASGEYHSGTPSEEMYISVHEFRGARAVVQRVLAAGTVATHVTAEELVATADEVES